MEIDKKRLSSEFSLNHEENFLVDLFGQVSERLKQKYNYSEEEIFGICNNERSLLVPITIFAGKLAPSEALTKFLKENSSLSYHEISGLIGRDEKSVWANYKRAAKKMPWHFEIKDSLTVPISIFVSEKSILEAVVCYLKDVKAMGNNKIAQLLNKNPANVWTVHNRATKKKSKLEKESKVHSGESVK